MIMLRLQKRYSVESMTRQNLVLLLPSSVLDLPITLLVFGAQVSHPGFGILWVCVLFALVCTGEN